MKTLIAEYNALAARLGQKPVNRFSDRKTAEKRLAKLKALIPAVEGTWAERVGYGKTKATEKRHALNMTPKQRKAFHAEVSRVWAEGGSAAVMSKWPNVSRRILAGHIRIAASRAD